MTPSSLKFLTGAPVSSALSWSDEGLLNTFSSALQRHLNHAHSAPPPSAPTQPVTKWRSIPLATNTTFHQSPVLHREFPRTNITAVPRQINYLKEDHDDFLDHSFALEANLQSSQIASHNQSLDVDPEEATFLTDDSVYSTNMDELDTTFMSTAASFRQEDSGPQSAVSSYRPVGPLMSIKAVPTAEYLLKIQPQTMTVNLLVGIISIAPARTVTTRKGGQDMDIIELTVGDETKAGFTISSWHRAQDSQQPYEDQSRTILSSLRPQDVVLIERVALSSFRNAVFGQSLNRRATKNATAITVLHKAHSLPLDTAQRLSFPRAVEDKLERVRDWVSSFVGPSAKRKAQSEPLPQAGTKKKSRSALLEEFLPADSQP